MKLYSKSDVKLADSSYSSLQLLSVLIAGFSLQALRSQLRLSKIDNTILGRLSILLIFIVFCSNLFISGTIAAHVSTVYSLLSRVLGSKDTKKDILESTVFAEKTKYLMEICLLLFWLNIPIFLIAVAIMLILRFKNLGNIGKYGIYFIAIIFLLAMLYQKYIHNYVFNEVTNEYKNRKMKKSQEGINENINS